MPASPCQPYRLSNGLVRPVVLTDDEYRQLLIDERVEREIATRWFRR